MKIATSYFLILFFWLHANLAAYDLAEELPLIEEELNEKIFDFRDFLKEFKVKIFLEFGPGFWTDYFLESCKKVYSVEFVTPGYGPNPIKNFLSQYADYANWIPIVFFSAYQGDTEWAPYKYLGSEHVHKAASYQCATHHHYALIDDFYLIELNAFINNIVKYNPAQAALVSSGLYIRGDLVQLLFGKIPIIFARDTSCRANGIADDVYGYSRVITPNDYEEIYISKPEGVTAWISKDEKYTKLIEELRSL